MRKKITFVTFFMMILTFNIYALHESHINIGLSFLNLYNITGDSIQSAGGNIGMAGVSINQYIFWNNRNVGLFAHSSFLNVVYLTNELNLFLYDSNYIGMTIGPGFRHNLNSKLKILTGTGIFFSGQGMWYVLTDDTSYKYKEDSGNFGLGGQAGLKLDLTDTVNIIFMLNANYTFVNFSANYTVDSTKWSVKSNVSINPYIGIGVNIVKKND
jgi:hypothetical protein